jgi:hypothetical protein
VEPATKPCRDCGEHKPLDQFPLQKGGRWGRHPLCKPCRAAQERARYQRDRDRILAAKRENPSYREKARWRQIRRKRGATREQYEAMYAEQAGCCDICGEAHDVLHVDHDHRTGAVRGLLCSRCNLALGHFRDDPARLRSAARYLRGTAT